MKQVASERFVDHFTRLMSPANMFVAPKGSAGIAEVPDFIEAFAREAHAV
jgi:hypothetical protein